MKTKKPNPINTKKLFFLVFWIATIMSFIINFLIALSLSEDFLNHEIGYYIGSFLASSTIGVIIAAIATMTWKKMYHVSY
ncbi:MAG: hypothetical protein ACYC6W_09725 [Nitrosotalea sp.]